MKAGAGTALGFLLLGSAGCRSAGFPAGCARNGPIAIVGVGTVHGIDLDGWARGESKRYGLPIELLDPMPVPDSAFDAQRQQLVAEDVIAVMNDLYRGSHPGGVLIALAGDDVYLRAREHEWKWAFGIIDGDSALLSTWHMAEAGHDPTPDRLSKMLGRYLGEMYCGWKRTGPTQSHMRREPILGPADVDEIEQGNFER